MTWKPDVCIHHFPCDDGFASAWVVRRKWPDTIFAPTNYGQPFPNVDIVGKNVLIADFSYKATELEKLAATVKSIVILDHHKTAQAELTRWDGGRNAASVVPRLDGLDIAVAQACTETGFPIVATFDMERSGASLTWDFCFPGEPRPGFIAMIEDRDLWRMKLPNTRAFSLYLRSFDYDFAVWDGVAARMQVAPHSVLDEAKAIERFYDRKIAEMMPTATLKAIGKWKDVPVAHAPYAFASDLAHELLQAYPQAPFAAVVVDSYGARTYSLRSTDERQDVSEVAKQFGGGGHRNAAGFRVPT